MNFFLSKSVSSYFKTKKKEKKFLMATKPRGGGGGKGLSCRTTKKRNFFCGFPYYPLKNQGFFMSSDVDTDPWSARLLMRIRSKIEKVPKIVKLFSHNNYYAPKNYLLCFVWGYYLCALNKSVISTLKNMIFCWSLWIFMWVFPYFDWFFATRIRIIDTDPDPYHCLWVWMSFRRISRFCIKTESKAQEPGFLEPDRWVIFWSFEPIR